MSNLKPHLVNLLERPLASYLDHTLLGPTTTAAAIEQLCNEALIHSFKAVCVNGCHLERATSLLRGSAVDVAAVVGFPLGANTTAAKCCEAENCMAAGAKELDVVLNLGWVKSENYAAILNELNVLRALSSNSVLKLILETCYLTDAEKIRVCELAREAQWDFVKTSTGFGNSGATVLDVELMKRATASQLLVKASGGIRDLGFALELIAAGADRLGTSSGIALMQAYNTMEL
ncbi:MAG: hypothetical protein RLZZ241_973 [Bacteroidota bacterium]|jgi:deoxyribose-phosphate aldolase